MTHNDENDIDIDTQEDFDKEPASRSSLKEAWDSNPMLKIGAVIVGLVVVFGAYTVFFSGATDEGIKSQIGKRGSEGVKNLPGTGASDPIYLKQVKEQNEKRAELAKNTGTSAIPTPTGVATSDALALPPPAPTPADDPLREWRQKAEAARMNADSEQVPDQPPAPTIQAPLKPITPAPQQKMDPNAAKALATQMRVIIAAQAPKASSRVTVTKVNSAYVQQQLDAQKKQTENGTTSTGTGASATASEAKDQAKPKLIVSAGSVAYAQLLTELNSDIQSPALAIILSGPFEGGKALGQFQKQDEYLTLTFTRIVKDGVSYSINGIALDENTTLPAQQSEVNHHYFQRVILPAAASFLTAYTAAVAQTSTETTTTSGGGVATSTPAPDTNEAINQGISSASNTVAGMLNQEAGRPITVIVHKGTTMGVLFLESVTTASASQ